MAEQELKQAVVYWSKFAVFECPYCDQTHYWDSEDMMSEEIDGERFACTKCGEYFRLRE